MEQLAQELAKVELERDRYKYEVEQKQQRLQEYEEQIVHYRTKALYSGGQSSTVYHSRMTELADSLTEHKCDLVTKEAKIKQLEDQLDNEKAEMEKERNAMKQFQDTKERELKQSIAKLQTDLDQAIAAKSLTEVQLKSIRKQYDEQKQQLQQINEEFGRTRQLLKLKEESSQNTEEIKGKLKAEITALDQTLKKKNEELIISQAKTKHLLQQLNKKYEDHVDLQNDLKKEKEKNKILEKEFQSLTKENQQSELKTTTKIDAMEEEHKKQVYELTTAIDEKIQLVADHEEKIVQLECQLQYAHNLVEQITQEKAILETELQLQQVRYASAILISHDHLLYMDTYTQCTNVLSIL